jgi:uncharacterized membrane protein (UPF0182 family)
MWTATPSTARTGEVLLTPRELDINQLPGGASSSWINPHFVYTHGYGVVLAPVSKLTPDGLPVLLIENAPPEIKTPSLKLTRPEIYYGEVVQEPVFVRTAQPEFNYPSGEKNELSRYEGTGGIPISSAAMRLAAAVRGGDINILLSNPITSESRMMIRRNIKERLQTLAGFIAWDRDPYLVITDEGRLVWMDDGYTYSNSHPYSRTVEVPDLGEVNYLRNAVKATIDAYDGTTRLYIFAPDDPIVRAYQRLFPALFHAAAEMPADLRRHARYPETLFRVQAEIYRTYHMLDPQAFYNKEDMWDLAKYTAAQEGQPEAVTPMYVVASLPKQNQAEFMLLLPFTPRNKDNLIGLMLARCDGDHLGEIVVLQLSKQELIFGPAQIAARINQEQTISKDLDAVEPAGFARAARADTGAAGGQYVPVCGFDLYTVQRDEHAAVEEDRAGGGESADLYGHLRAGARAAFLAARRRWCSRRSRTPPKVGAPAAAATGASTRGSATGARAGAFAAVS